MALTFSSHNLHKIVSNCRYILFGTRVNKFSTSVTEIKDKNEEFDLEEYDENIVDFEHEVEAKRNKSRLNSKHRNILMGMPPEVGSDDFHSSLKYKRKMYGMYGEKSGIDPGTLYPTQDDINDIIEYESVAYPYSIQEMIARSKQRKENEEQIVQTRQKKITENLKKVNQWMKEVEAKKEKKLKELADSKSKRDKLLEEVRRQIGYNVDMKDEKFKLALQQKEKENKKKLKEEKRQAKQERLLKALDKEAVS